MRRKVLIGAAALVLLSLVLVAGPALVAATGMEPGLCGSCHAMEHYRDTYWESPHAGVTTCSDCHMPYAFVQGLKTKYSQGIHHVQVVLADQVPEEIRLSEAGRHVLMDNCVSCHALSEHVADSGTRSCLNCHADDPHGGGVAVIISGLVIQVRAEAAAVADALRARPGILRVELPAEPCKVVAVLEAESEEAIAAAVEAIGKLERVLGVYPAYIDFGEGESTCA